MNLVLSRKLQEALDLALSDPVKHRKYFHGDFFYPKQAEVVNLVEKHIRERSGKVLTIRMPRQIGKNECSAMIATRAFLRYQTTGGSIIRIAPTYRPQLVNSKLRIEKLLNHDALMSPKKLQRKEGFIFQYGNVFVFFLSADPTANVEGATASILLDVDEAHHIDPEVYDAKFSPMCAFQAVPSVLWGVAADKTDLLYRYRMRNENGDKSLNLQFPASDWCEVNPDYARYYTERVQQLGRSHPIIQTQYDLIDIDSLGGYFRSFHVESVLTSDHGQTLEPRDFYQYLFLIDIGGESEKETEDFDEMSEGSRDSTVIWIVEIDVDNLRYEYPLYRLVHGYWWTGKQLSGSRGSGLAGQQEIMLNLIDKWKPLRVIVDARGVGEQIAATLQRHYSMSEPYKASQSSVSADCYGLLSLINNDRVKMWRDNQDPMYEEFVRQLKWTKYRITGHDFIKIEKPSTNQHIDMVKALTYLGRVNHRELIAMATPRGRML